MPKKPEKWQGPDLVWVRWVDAAFDNDHEGTNDRVLETDSFGILLEENRHVVKIAQSGYGPEYDYESCAERLTIPRRMVKFVRVVRGFKA